MAYNIFWDNGDQMENDNKLLFIFNRENSFAIELQVMCWLLCPLNLDLDFNFWNLTFSILWHILDKCHLC